MHFWVNPNSTAAAYAKSYADSGDTTDAALMQKIASHAMSTWLTNSYQSTIDRVATVVKAAAAAGQVPVFVAYNLPNRDCGGYSAGGANSASDYAIWIRKVAAALNTGAPSVVVLEPDAVPLATVGCLAATVASVQATLKDAVSVLKAVRARVYVDAGNPGWIPDPTNLITVLKGAGIGGADGFALNTSNFFTTSTNTTYGQKISAQLNYAHWVIDTSRNGLGPLPPNSGYTGPSWCNPPGRALGNVPTSNSGIAGVDAFLWVKTPGASDGDCGIGDPPAGTYWPDYALGLAARASW